MKSFKKLRDFALQSHKSREKSNNPQAQHHHVQPTEDGEMVAKGMKDVRDMRKHYEELVTVSSQVSNRAYELSAAVEDMASYFTTTYGLLDDKEIGQVFKLVGEVQFEISKSLELYASHVSETVTGPTENLIGELQHVTETKKEHDEKRQSLDQFRMRVARGRSKNLKGEAQDDQHLEAAKEEFDEVSRSLGRRLLSLQQERPRSLITQAAHHHSAQMQLFSKGLTSLHGIQPHMKQVTQELNIDRRWSSADGDVFEDGDDEAMSNTEAVYDYDDASYVDDADQDQDQRHARDRDLGSESSENGADDAELDLSQEWSSLMEVSGSDRPGTFANEGFDSPVHYWTMNGSQSAPTSPIANSGGVDNIQEIDRSPHIYVSAVPPPTRYPPVPSDRVHSGTLHYDMHAHEYNPSTSQCSPTRSSPHHYNNIPASSPRLHGRTTKMGVPMTMFPPFEPSSMSWPMPLPPSADPPPVLTFEAPSLSSTPRGFVSINSITPRKKRYSYSGPLTSSATASGRSTSSDFASSGLQQLRSVTYRSGQLTSSHGHMYKSPILSPTASPPKISPPRISELHKLPPPPLSASSSPVTASTGSLIAHSASLPRPEPPTLNASPLPPPPLGNGTRSLSLGAPDKSQKQQRFKGPSTTQLADVKEEANFSSSELKQVLQSGHRVRHSAASKHQSPMLHRSVSGSASPRNGALETRESGKTQPESVEKKIRRLNTMLHTSASMTPYSVSSPPTVSAADARERAQPGSDFDLVRRSVDVAVPASNSTSKWSKWKSFSADDRDGIPTKPITRHQSWENSRMYGHSPSPRHVLMNCGNGSRHV